MRLFAEYGSPSTVGDIAYVDYLFLGDYVDRGAFSLETMSLLLALKVEYPDTVHLLRGNHEEADINALFGFRIECIERLGEEAGITAWNRFNVMFQWLPLAAVIEDRVACMHGGIGRSITHISQLEELERPLTMDTGGIILMDVLWSDPTESDRVEGLRPNARGPGLVTFGPDRVRKFCEDNDLQMIIRAHECVMDGFERFAQGMLITVFSATNYCGTANNAGAILVLGRDLTLYPKLIHPLPPSALYGSAGSTDEDMDGPWQMGLNKERPPTPPRGEATGVVGPADFWDEERKWRRRVRRWALEVRGGSSSAAAVCFSLSDGTHRCLRRAEHLLPSSEPGLFHVQQETGIFNLDEGVDVREPGLRERELRLDRVVPEHHLLLHRLLFGRFRT